MPEIGNRTAVNAQRLTVRVGQGSLSFSILSPGTDSVVTYEPYAVKSGISMVANLREALKTLPFGLEQRRRVLVLLDMPVVFVPADEFSESAKTIFYTHTLTGQDGNVVLSTVIPLLNAVALYGINKDLKQVFDDNFEDVRYSHTCIAVLNALYKRSFTGQSRKLFCHFHGRRLDIYSFGKNRFKFANSYDAVSPHDAVYFILHVWQQLAFDRQKDELHITGSVPDGDILIKELGRYVKNVCMISPKAEFNRSPVTDIKGMPYDLMAYFIR